MLQGLRQALSRTRATGAARRAVEAELISLNGAVSHALRSRDPLTLSRLPGTPQWERYEAELARGRRSRTRNLRPAYDSYHALLRAVAEAQSSGAPLTERSSTELDRLWSAARHAHTDLEDAITRVAPLPGRVGMRGGRG